MSPDLAAFAGRRGAPAARAATEAPENEDAGTRSAVIDRLMIRLFALVCEAIAGATSALLSGDRETAKRLVAQDDQIDRLYREIEDVVQRELALQGGSAAKLRYLVTILRMLPELERSGDLAEHVARRATRGIAMEMSARARGLVEAMGEVACAMWRMAADAFGDGAPDVAERLDELDDEMDELHVTLTAELVGSGMAIAVIIELVLVARFYERLGDHAVNLARRVPEPAGREGFDYRPPGLSLAPRTTRIE